MFQNQVQWRYIRYSFVFSSQIKMCTTLIMLSHKGKKKNCRDHIIIWITRLCMWLFSVSKKRVFKPKFEKEVCPSIKWRIKMHSSSARFIKVIDLYHMQHHIALCQSMPTFARSSGCNRDLVSFPNDKKILELKISHTSNSKLSIKACKK